MVKVAMFLLLGLKEEKRESRLAASLKVGGGNQKRQNTRP